MPVVATEGRPSERGPLADGDACLGVADSAGAAPGPGDGGPEFFGVRFWGMAGDFLEGTVLLRWIPPLAANEPPYVGVDGLRPPFDCLDCLDDTDTFLRTPPNFRTLSAPALAFEEDLATLCLCLLGVTGVPGVAPLWTSWTVFSSAAVPLIPIRKWS
jgi:hypothetical protein